MNKDQRKPLANYEVPFLPLPCFQPNASVSTHQTHAYEVHYLPSQYQVKANCLSKVESLEVYKRPKYLTILTYNVWFQEHNTHIRFPAILRLLEETLPDIICLQEVTPKFLQALTSSPFAKHYYMPALQIDWYDTLILSRYPCRFYKKPFVSSQMERSNLAAVVEFFQEGIETTFKVAVNCVHLESSESHGPRMQQLEEIKTFNQIMDFSIIAGDFNFFDGCPENKAIETYTDVWKAGQRHFSKWANEQMKEKGFTMPANERSPAVRLDHIIYRENCKLEKDGRDQIAIIGDFTIPYYEKDHFSKIFHDFVVRTPSDHFGLIAKITL